MNKFILYTPKQKKYLIDTNALTTKLEYAGLFTEEEYLELVFKHPDVVKISLEECITSLQAMVRFNNLVKEDAL